MSCFIRSYPINGGKILFYIWRTPIIATLTASFAIRKHERNLSISTNVALIFSFWLNRIHE